MVNNYYAEKLTQTRAKVDLCRDQNPIKKMENRITEQLTINVPLALYEAMQKKWIREVMAETRIESKENLPEEVEEYLTRKELAKRLKLSLGTLRNRVREGKLKSYRLHGKILFKWSEVKESLKAIRYC